ncbi:MAG: hypothetical protein GY906_22580 [bacterium]|nr:hypothetical protein [bacterium]
MEDTAGEATEEGGGKEADSGWGGGADDEGVAVDGDGVAGAVEGGILDGKGGSHGVSRGSLRRLANVSASVGGIGPVSISPPACVIRIWVPRGPRIKSAMTGLWMVETDSPSLR